MIKYYQRTIKEGKPHEIREFRPGTWVYVEQPTKEELDQLAERFSLDRGLLADAVDPNEVPRVESEEGVMYVFTRVPSSEADERIVTLPMLIAVGGDFVLTVVQRPLPLLEKFFSGRIDFHTTQKSRLFTQIFVEINSAYNSFLNGISKSIRGMSIHLERVENRDILRFVVYEEVLNDFLAALVPTNTILRGILSGRFFQLYEDDKDLTEDVLLGNGQLIEVSKSNLKTIVNIREASSTIMTNNLNRVIRLLTSLTVVLTVPTMIASFFGMNVRLPYADAPMAFFGIVVFTAAILGIILGIFVRNRWL